MQAPLELVGLGSSSSMDYFASWKMNGSGMEKEEREKMRIKINEVYIDLLTSVSFIRIKWLKQ